MTTCYYLISIDCESTGLSVYNDQIVEFGGAISKWNVDTNEITELKSFCEYAKPSIATMSKKAEEITGIHAKTLKDSEYISKVFVHFSEHVNSVCTETYPRLLLSYNGFRYDIPLICNELERIEKLYSLAFFRQLCIAYTIDILPFCREEMDTTMLKRKANGKCSFKLGDVYMSVCQCPLKNAHGALEDSMAVINILKNDASLLTRFKQIVLGLESCVDTTHCKNPMTFIRSIVGKKRKRSASQRPFDMIKKFKETAPLLKKK
jgi:DNA polymerase III alpha subunit (gram-positive type)